MPELGPKIVQKELENGQLWPVYWIYGHERLKATELTRRIRKLALGISEEGPLIRDTLREDVLDGSEITSSQLLDAAQSPALGGGLRFITVKNAQALKDLDVLTPLLGQKSKKEDLFSVTVFLSNDLDKRKRFSKTLLEQAAVVPCEEIADEEREPWIYYLAKRRGLEINEQLAEQLCRLEPWNLDIVERELEKLELSRMSEAGAPSASESDVLLSGDAVHAVADKFLNSFFTRNLSQALSLSHRFADQPSEAIPLLGLLAWNVRHLALIKQGPIKLGPYQVERFRKWAAHWESAEVQELQQALLDLDFGMKQTPKLPLGLWTELVTRFGRHAS